MIHHFFARVDAAYIHHKIHHTGIMIIDVRAAKTFNREHADNQGKPIGNAYLGNAQWKAMKRALSPDGYFADCTNLIVASPVPVAFLSPSMTMMIAKGSGGAADDLEGIWTGNGKEELAPFLEMLYQWKSQQGKGQTREVTIAAGDIHIGVCSEIYTPRGDWAFSQITSSAIHNTALAGTALGMIEAASTGFGRAPLVNGWEFGHAYLTQRNNYGLIEVNQTKGRPHVRSSLVEDARGKEGPKSPRRAAVDPESVLDNRVRRHTAHLCCSPTCAVM